MDRLAARRLRRGDDRRHVQVALRGGGRADADGAVGEPCVQCAVVGGRVDRHRFHPELVESADHAHRDLAAIRNEDAGEHHWFAQSCFRMPASQAALGLVDPRAVEDAASRRMMGRQPPEGRAGRTT